MRIFLNILITCSLFVLLTACTASAPLSTSIPTPTITEIMVTDPFEINQNLGRSVNLGNALEGPTEGAWGVTLEEEYFQLIADQGFDAVRIPIRWSAHASKTAPYKIVPSFMDRVDWAVENALARDLAVVINFHHYDEIFTDPEGHTERFLALWEQVAAHFQDAPPEVVFEILNEPHDKLTSSKWNGLLFKTLEIIRKTNPDRTVMIGPGFWNNLSELKNLHLPEEDQNIIVTFHYYSPFEFTHQGAEWADGSADWLGTTWEGTAAQKAALRSDMQVVAKWAAEHQRPIFLGEFGAYSKADLSSRSMWTAAVARTAEEFGFSWAYWEFCAGFGIYDPQLHTWNSLLVDALIPEN